MQTRSLVTASSDGTPLFVRVHRPLSAGMRRQLVIVHGAGQHGGRYDPLASLAVTRGWTVVAFDLRGHGRSGGVPTHLDQFDQYLEDIDAVLLAVAVNPARSVLFGHSLGGLIVARYLQTRDAVFGAAVLSSPLLALRLKVSQMKLAVGRLCALMAPRTRFKTEIREEHLTSNVAALERRRSDPLSHRSVTAGWYFQVLDAVCEAWNATDRVALPLMILQGDADPVVDPEAVYRWLPRVASKDKTLQVLPDQRHEILHEPGWEQTVEDMLSWLDRRTAAERAIRRAA
ncbi:MAG: lysophospholipase [Planctomycetaceae bacterium]